MSTTTDFSLEPFLTNDFGDRYLYPVNRDVFNKVGAETIFQKHFSSVLQLENTLHVFIGLDSGLLLEFLQKKQLPKGCHCLLVELPEILNRLHKEGHLTELTEQITCCDHETFLSRFEKGDFRQYFYLDRVQIRKSLAAEDAHLPEYHALHSLAEDRISQMRWDVRTSINTSIYFEEQLKNLPENRIHARSLKGIFQGKTAVLLAGGPSLDAILPWVSEHRDRLVVLAVSRIARRLQDVGLTPDIICAIDPQQVCFDVSREMLLFSERTLFLNLFHVSNTLLSNWQGSSTYVGPRFPWETPLNPKDHFIAGPTVTNVALATAISMGFSQIVLGGVDLCYSREGYSHARGSYETQAGPRFNIANEARIATNGGWMAPTTQAMIHAAQTLDEQAAEALEQGCRLVTTSLGGAKMDHVEYRPKEQLELPMQPFPAWETISASLPADSSEIRLAHYLNTMSELNRGKEQLVKIVELCDLALKYNDGLFGRNGMKKNFKYKKKLDGIERQLNDDFQDFAPLVKKYGLQDFLQLSSPIAKEYWSDAEIEMKGRNYYQTYQESSRQLIEKVSGAMELIELRISEEDFPKDLPRLAQSWRERKEPGRVRLWKSRRSEAPYSYGLEEQKCLEGLEQAFQELLQNSEREKGHLKWLKARAHPDEARKKAMLHFRRQDSEALQFLHSALATIDQQEAIVVNHLVAGFLAELSENSEQALEEYNAVINEPICSCTEEALRRIVSISLELSDTNNALAGLECLSNLSPIYLLQYADLVKLLGDTNQALDLYANYLDNIPDDPQVLMRVGKIYQELGMTNEALTVFRYLSEKDPDNSLFQTLVSQLETPANNDSREA